MDAARKITRATTADCVVIAYLFNDYRVFYHQPPDVEGAKNFIRERLQNNESVIFLAFLNEEPVGFTQLYPIFSSVSMRSAWLLNDLYVDEKARGNGLATGLLEAAKAHCRASESKWLLLQTGRDNLTAQALYAKNGWEKETDFFYQFTV